MSFRDVLLQVGFLMAAAAGVLAAWALLSGEFRRPQLIPEETES